MTEIGPLSVSHKINQVNQAWIEIWGVKH